MISATRPVLVRYPVLLLTTVLVVAGTIVVYIDSTAIESFGFLPLHAWRSAGLTPISAFVLHTGVGHVGSNLLVLWFFGRAVERRLGWWTALLLTAGAYAGAFAHQALTSSPNIVLVGASGGIAALIGFVLVAAPRDRFHLGDWSCPLWVPAALWLVIQLVSLPAFINVTSHHDLISAGAHVGGFALGAFIACAWRASSGLPERTTQQ